MLRVGLGWDLHRLVKGRDLVLGGVKIPFAKGEKAHSDGDVLLHAVTDALLGASGMGDIGSFFPPEDKKWKDADSKFLLKTVWEKIRAQGWRLENLDCVLLLEQPKLLPFRDEIRKSISTILDVPEERVFIKGKTFERLECVGKGRAVQSFCTALLLKDSGTSKKSDIPLNSSPNIREKDNPEISLVLNNRAGILEDSGDYSGARAIYEDLGENYKKNIGYYYNYSLFLFNRGEYGSCIKILQEGLADYPGSLDLWELKGLAEMENGNLKAATASFSAAIALNGDKFSLWNNRGVAFFKQEKYEDAIFSFKKAFELNNQDYDILFNLRDASFMTGDRDTAAWCEQEMKRLGKK